tara:strand:- start:13388 stop:14413 length:1026 start_codon:yes stop_codon:yes gene_type:complete
VFSIKYPKTLSGIRELVKGMPGEDYEAQENARSHERLLTKPRGSLGQLEKIYEWLATWQKRYPAELNTIQILIFAGNHEVSKYGVSAYPSEVTQQMVNNFEIGGAAINQLSNLLNADLRVIPLKLDTPVKDFTLEPAMGDAECLEAFCSGMHAVDKNSDLICLGEMGISNTTAAAALAAILYGGNAKEWVGLGTGIDDNSLKRKQEIVDRGLKTHLNSIGDPLKLLCCFGGREFAAIAGALVAARYLNLPVMLDGFTCTVAAAVIEFLHAGALNHCMVSHCSAEMGHRKLLNLIKKDSLFDFKMRLGEASGAALGAMIVQAACRVHNGMATFDEAGVSERE